MFDKDKEIARVAREAADVIERDGWTFGSWGSGTSPKCIEGGLMQAIFGKAYGGEEQRMGLMKHPVYAAVQKFLGLDYTELPNWNDNLPNHKQFSRVAHHGKRMEAIEKHVIETLRAVANFHDPVEVEPVEEKVKRMSVAMAAVSSALSAMVDKTATWAKPVFEYKGNADGTFEFVPVYAETHKKSEPEVLADLDFETPPIEVEQVEKVLSTV